MAKRIYKVVIFGIKPEKQINDVITALGNLFKTKPSHFKPLTKGIKITVCQNADSNKVILYKNALEKIGCKVSIEAIEHLNANYSHTDNQHDSFMCPKCQFPCNNKTLRGDECPKCGIIFSKFYKNKKISTEIQYREKLKNNTSSIKNKNEFQLTIERRFFAAITTLFTILFVSQLLYFPIWLSLKHNYEKLNSSISLSYSANPIDQLIQSSDNLIKHGKNVMLESKINEYSIISALIIVCILFPLCNEGVSIGQKIMNIKLHCNNRPYFKIFIMRTIGNTINLLSYGVINILLIYLRKDKRNLSDLISKTKQVSINNISRKKYFVTFILLLFIGILHIVYIELGIKYRYKSENSNKSAIISNNNKNLQVINTLINMSSDKDTQILRILNKECNNGQIWACQEIKNISNPHPARRDNKGDESRSYLARTAPGFHINSNLRTVDYKVRSR